MCMNYRYHTTVMQQRMFEFVHHNKTREFEQSITRTEY